MKQKLLKSILLLCALVAGSSNVWAETKSVDITPTQALNEGGVDPITITCAKGDGTSNPAISSGQLRLYQAGSGKTTGNTITFSSEKTITSIVFTFANSMTAANGSFSTGSYTNSTSTWTGSTNSVTLTVTGTTSSTRIYITAMTVYYSDGDSSTPSLSADNVNLDYDATSGEFAYTLTNPVDGATLEASTTDDWISNVVVDTENTKVTFITTANSTSSPRVGTITVTYSKSGEDLATKEVTITQAKEVIAVNYSLATKITPGRHYILVGIKSDAYYAMGAQNSNNRAAVAITVTDGKTSIPEDAEVYEICINGDITTGYYTIYDEKSSGYLYAACGTGTSNYMRTETTLDDDGNGTWIMSVDGSGIISCHASNPSLGRPWMRFNGGSLLFSCYQNSDSQSNIYLYERDSDTNTQTASVSLASACTDGTKFYGTFSCPFSFVVPADLTVSAISVDDGKLVVSDYATNDIVKANTGMMIASTTSGEHEIVLSGEVGIEKDGNMLKPTGTGDGIEAADMDEADTKFYRLTMHNGTQIGFWWGAAEGAAFAVAANKAYLAVPNGSGAREGLWFNDDVTTGINAVENGETVKAVYNLAGQRVTQPTRGLYIVNGKKIVIK